MQGDVKFVDIFQRRLGDNYVVRAIVSLDRLNKLVPQIAELVLELRQCLSDLELANRI